jgi:hypothetical protein
MSFHVPEAARVYHVQFATSADGNNGAFFLESPEPGWQISAIASDGLDWEHVSAFAFKKSGQQRTPTWREMAYLKDLFWDPEDVAMQLHPRRSQYVNAHPHVLHIWRPIGAAIPEPPAYLVGPIAAEAEA